MKARRLVLPALVLVVLAFVGFLALPLLVGNGVVRLRGYDAEEVAEVEERWATVVELAGAEVMAQSAGAGELAEIARGLESHDSPAGDAGERQERALAWLEGGEARALRRGDGEAFQLVASLVLSREDRWNPVVAEGLLAASQGLIRHGDALDATRGLAVATRTLARARASGFRVGQLAQGRGATAEHLARAIVVGIVAQLEEGLRAEVDLAAEAPAALRAEAEGFLALAMRVGALRSCERVWAGRGSLAELSAIEVPEPPSGVALYFGTLLRDSDVLARTYESLYLAPVAELARQWSERLDEWHALLPQPTSSR